MSEYFFFFLPPLDWIGHWKNIGLGDGVDMWSVETFQLHRLRWKAARIMMLLQSKIGKSEGINLRSLTSPGLALDGTASEIGPQSNLALYVGKE